MSYTFAVCHATLPHGFEAAAREVESLARQADPEPAVFGELMERLTARYPCLCDLPDDLVDDSPWASGPLRRSEYRRSITLGLSRQIEDVLPFVIETANSLGLTVLDWQTGEIHRP